MKLVIVIALVAVVMLIAGAALLFMGSEDNGTGYGGYGTGNGAYGGNGGYGTDNGARGFKYIGCYADTHEKRDLPVSVDNKADKSVQECVDYARKHGYRYAGLQYAIGRGDPTKGECWVGNDYGKHGSSNLCVDYDAEGNVLGAGKSNAVYEVL